MVSAQVRSAGLGSRVLIAVGCAVCAAVFAGGPQPSAARADDKPVAGTEEKKENPLRAEVLKLNSVTGEEAQKTKLLALSKDKEKAKKLVVEAGKMLKEAKGKDNPFKYNGALMVARLAHFNRQFDVAEPFYEYLVETATKLKSGAKLAEANEGLIDMLYDNKKYAQAAELCEKYVAEMGSEEYESGKAAIVERWVQSLAKDEKFDEALRLVGLLIEDKATAWYFLQLKGWVLREQGKLGDAIGAYVESLDLIDAHKVMTAEVKDRFRDRTRYILTGLYVDNKQVNKAAKELQTLIKRNPDNPTYKNDLGFIWCDNDLNLEESEKLIKDALDLDTKEQEKLKKEGKLDEVKPNAAYLDSLGWVLFKQKKYAEALDPLKKAAADDEDGSHLEIWDHLADCHLALGQKKEAIAAWEKGLKFEDLSKRDAERRRKVSEKLKKARAEKD
jgi:tetratricopeptide (TPR) repeat protein